MSEYRRDDTASWDAQEVRQAQGARREAASAHHSKSRPRRRRQNPLAVLVGYLIFVLLYVPCISVMGAIARESSRGWMGFSILWGLNIAYSLATLFYQVASYSQHPTYSLVCILAVILFNIVVIGLLRRARSRVDIELLATRKSVSSCCAASTTGDCH